MAIKSTIAEITNVISALEVVDSTGAYCDDTLCTFEHVVIDSRIVKAGALFICIKGERVDGHDFALEVVAKGAVALFAERDPFANMEERPNVIVFIVENTVKALGALGAWHREKATAHVIGVTGTAGKTTVKELLAHVLSVRGAVAKNPLNLNNQIGLPLSMLAASGKEAFWVMEAGISEAHDMDELGALLRPDMALILNVGQGHTLGLGRRVVAHYKSRLLAYLTSTEDDVAIISADYNDLVREARLQRRNILFFSSQGRPMPYRAAYMGAEGEHRRPYRLWLDGTVQEIVAPFRGAFGAENVVAVATIAHRLGLSGDEIAEGFATATLPKQRLHETIGTYTLIDDTYNANPLSMTRMIEGTGELASGSLVFVLGEMLELGSEAEDAHEELGSLLATTKACDF